MVKLESKASRELVKGALETKADQADVAEMQSRVGRWRSAARRCDAMCRGARLLMCLLFVFLRSTSLFVVVFVSVGT